MTLSGNATAASASRAAALRIGISVLGLLTLTLSCWWIAGDQLASDPQLAAEVGLIRPELWTRSGWAQMNQAGVTADPPRAAFEHAVKLSPMDSEAWFGLALLTERLARVDPTSAQALKMSFYTSFNTKALMPDRFLMLARTDASQDAELQDMLARQTKLILTRMPDFKSALRTAYRAASGTNRQIIADNVRALGQDPTSLLDEPAR